MDIVTLGAALNGSAEYVNSHFKGGSNIQIVDNPDGTQTINASGEVSSEDTVARADIAAIKDGETLDSFGDVETALATKANASTTYTKTEVDTALSAKANSADVYSKSDIDTAMSAKADKSTTYTKTEVDTALSGKVDKETGKGLSTNDYTTDEKTKLADIAEGAEVNVQSNWAQTTTTADDYIKNKPTLGTAAAKNATDTYNATGTDVTTGKAVAEALATLPEPMVFKGSLGTGGTITTLPTASGSNKGYVYKVITTGTYASQSAKVGDTFISDGSAWVLIPSGDEPSGTVTNVAVANGGGLTVSGSPITSSGTITVGHSNSVTAKTSSSVKKFTYDAYGHVTDSSELSTAESNALVSGIDSEKVAQIETNKNNISTDEAALVELVDGGAKNLSEWAGGTTETDGSFVVQNEPITLKKATYVISFNTTANSGRCEVVFRDENNNVGSYTFNNISSSKLSSEITLTADAIKFNIFTTKAATITNFMVCTKAAWDISQTYQPYRPSYQELYERVETNKNNILYAQKTGVKNIMDLSKYKELNPSVVVGDNLVFHGVTWTISNSSGLTVSGASDSGGSYPTIYSATLPIGTYYLSGGDSTIELLTPTSQHESGQGLTIEITESTTQPYIIRGFVPPNTSITGTHNIKPMLRQVGDSTFEPYAMSNAELTAAIQALQAQLANQ